MNFLKIGSCLQEAIEPRIQNDEVKIIPSRNLGILYRVNRFEIYVLRVRMNMCQLSSPQSRHLFLQYDQPN